MSAQTDDVSGSFNEESGVEHVGACPDVYIFSTTELDNRKRNAGHETAGYAVFAVKDEGGNVSLRKVTSISTESTDLSHVGDGDEAFIAVSGGAVEIINTHGQLMLDSRRLESFDIDPGELEAVYSEYRNNMSSGRQPFRHVADTLRVNGVMA